MGLFKKNIKATFDRKAEPPAHDIAMQIIADIIQSDLKDFTPAPVKIQQETPPIEIVRGTSVAPVLEKRDATPHRLARKLAAKALKKFRQACNQYHAG